MPAKATEAPVAKIERETYVGVGLDDKGVQEIAKDVLGLIGPELGKRADATEASIKSLEAIVLKTAEAISNRETDTTEMLKGLIEEHKSLTSQVGELKTPRRAIVWQTTLAHGLEGVKEAGKDNPEMSEEIDKMIEVVADVNRASLCSTGKVVRHVAETKWLGDGAITLVTAGASFGLYQLIRLVATKVYGYVAG